MTFAKRNPAVLIGLLGSLLVVVGQVLSGGLTWAAALPVIAGIVTRQFVMPTPPAGLADSHQQSPRS